MACVHKFTISNGRVTYFNRFLDTVFAKRCMEDKRLYPVFGTSDVCSNIFGRFKTLFTPNETLDNTNVTVFPYGPNQLYALTETGYMSKLDPNDLSVLDILKVTDVLPTASSTIAHPHIEEDGSWLIVGMNRTSKQEPRYEFIRFRGGKEAAEANNLMENGEVIASTPSSHYMAHSYTHGFGMSQNYIIYIEQSMIFDLKEYIICLAKNKPYSSALKMLKDFRPRIHLVNRHTGEVVAQKFTTDPLFVFHHINAYETTDSAGEQKLIIDISAYDADTFEIDEFSYEGMFSEEASGAETFHSPPSRIEVPINQFDPEGGEIFCKLQRLNPEISIELPVINYAKYNGQKYQYMYGVNLYKAPYSIVKVNADKPTDYLEKKYSTDKIKMLPNEPIFVPSPDPKSEDDGVLLVMVLSEQNDFLSILDAKDLSEIARAELPEGAKAAFTFHGIFDDRKFA